MGDISKIMEALRLHMCNGVRTAHEVLREAERKLLAAARVVLYYRTVLTIYAACRFMLTCWSYFRLNNYEMPSGTRDPSRTRYAMERDRVESRAG